MSRPTCIDLFAGAGGLSLGFEQAGFDVVAAVEIDPIHAAAHQFNFPNCVVIPRSVEGLTGKEIRQAAKIGRRRIDVVVGGAPCQGFSLIGHRALDDPRNSLVSEFVRIVGELKASYFVFENVKGLTVGRQRRFLEEVIAAFSDIGYRVQTPWKVLGATAFSLQSHLRTTVKAVGQIEIDELYVAVDKKGRHYIVPIQAKGGRDKLSVVQTQQDLAWAHQRFPNLMCRPISAQFMEGGTIALFELIRENGSIKIVEERHYRLVSNKELTSEDLESYRRST